MLKRFVLLVRCVSARLYLDCPALLRSRSTRVCVATVVSRQRKVKNKCQLSECRCSVDWVSSSLQRARRNSSRRGAPQSWREKKGCVSCRQALVCFPEKSTGTARWHSSRALSPLHHGACRGWWLGRSVGARALTLPTAQRDGQVLTGNGMAGEAQQLAFAPCHLLLECLVRSQR